MKKFAVIGNPIGHSRSPEIHAAFAKSCGIQMTYERILAPIDGFSECIDQLRAQKYLGANVTVPFKVDAFNEVDVLSESARWAGAVNTLSFTELCLGDNTDGLGLVRDITVNLNFSIKNKKILLLGAGGAARGVLRPLLQEQPELIVVKNRSLAKAEHWLNEVKKNQDYGQVLGNARLNVMAWSDQTAQNYDLIINATASGLEDGFVAPAGVDFEKDALAYDMMYGKKTAFLEWANQHALKPADGWGMLVEQAAKSFEIWHGVTPDTHALIHSRGA